MAKWVLASYLVIASNGGVSAMELMRQMGSPQLPGRVVKRHGKCGSAQHGDAAGDGGGDPAAVRNRDA